MPANLMDWLFAKTTKQNSCDDFHRELLHVREWTRSLQNVTDPELASGFSQLGDQIDSKSNPREQRQLIATAAAYGAEAVSRVNGFRLHDVQLVGAIATALGSVIEMQTGEGKTLVCGLASIIRSVFQPSIHVATTNMYLAQRDHATNVPIFDLLGITSACIGPESTTDETRSGYRSRITYAPGYTFGFDYLRDQIYLRELEKMTLGRDILQQINGVTLEDQLLQTGLHCIIVDEADSVLIDEATTPLLLSGPPDTSASLEAYKNAWKSFQLLDEEDDFQVLPAEKKAQLTDSGLKKVHEHLRGYGRQNLIQPWPKYVENAIYAEYLLVADEDYVVDDDKIKLVDQNTGRIFDDRTLKAGLHQALEVKENVAVNYPNTTLARVTRQRFFQMYDAVCGMTGTITGSEKEVAYFYESPIVPLPPNRPSKRDELPDRYFSDSYAKLRAVVNEVKDRRETNQPILVGTRTINESRQLHEALREEGIQSTLLNGTQNADEAEIVAQAGVPGAITIATNMAGRGTDIKLGNEAKNIGGLHVIGFSRSESRRVDRQLAGRSARQGDPGSCQFFVSADDQLIQDHDASLAKRMINSANRDGECCADYSSQVISLQKRIEIKHFERRRRVFLQDNWMDQVRETMVGC